MQWLLLFGLWICYLAFGAIASSLAPLVGVIEADLGLSHAAMGSIMGAWQLAYIAAAIPGGLLLDRLGSRRALLIGVLLIAASAAGRALADGYWALLGVVMVFGIGGPIISSGAPKVVAQVFTGTRRGLAMGIYITGPTLGGILALTLTHPLLMPLFEESWRAVMLLWSGVALLAAILWWAITAYCGQRVPGFPEASDTADSVISDNPGAVTVTPDRSVVMILLGMPAVRLVLAMSVGVFLINHGLSNWLPELLRSGGMSITAAGYWAALPMLVGILGSLTIPRLATPRRRFHILAGLCLAGSLSCLLLLTTAPMVLTGALLLQGLVRASLMTVLILTLMELPGMNPRRTGTASGLFFSFAEVGGVLGPLGLGLLYDATGSFGPGLFALAAVAGAMVLASARLAHLARPAPLARPAAEGG